MLTNSAERMKVNIFMTFDELSEYILVTLDRHELIVKVLYYRAEKDEITDIDLDKFEVVKSFTCANLEEAELKYSEWNDLRIAVSMISEYLKNQN
ncbi:trypsin [Solibacillus sp. FSL H8-0538]|uniref:trypsin n=1 Tax=Solibacillus sp. FSL H8-0538 TaxID=2921400 RepID=UPI0030F6968F